MKKYQNYTIEYIDGKYILKYKGIKLLASYQEKEAVEMVQHHITNIRHLNCEELTINDFQEV